MAMKSTARYGGGAVHSGGSSIPGAARPTSEQSRFDARGKGTISKSSGNVKPTAHDKSGTKLPSARKRKG